MRPDTPAAAFDDRPDADPADAFEQDLDAAPDPDEEPRDAATEAEWEADPADVADQVRDAGQDEDGYGDGDGY